MRTVLRTVRLRERPQIRVRVHVWPLCSKHWANLYLSNRFIRRKHNPNWLAPPLTAPCGASWQHAASQSLGSVWLRLPHNGNTRPWFFFFSVSLASVSDCAKDFSKRSHRLAANQSSCRITINKSEKQAPLGRANERQLHKAHLNIVSQAPEWAPKLKMNFYLFVSNKHQ